MNDIIFDAVKYINDDFGNTVGVNATKDGVIYGIPLDPANRHYAEIMRQVEAGELTIADAE
jgi:hypothetical protein